MLSMCKKKNKAALQYDGEPHHIRGSAFTNSPMILKAFNLWLLSNRMESTTGLKSTSTPLRYPLDYVNRSPALDPFEWSPTNEAQAPSNVYSSDCNTSSTHTSCTPSHTDRLDSRQTRRSSQRRHRDRSRSDDQPGFGPKNLLCLFEEIAVEA